VEDGHPAEHQQRKQVPQRRQQAEYAHNDLTDGNVHSKVRYAEPGVLGAETVDEAVMVVAVYHGQVSFSLIDTILPQPGWKIINKL